MKNLPNHHNPLGTSLASICLKQKSEHLMAICVLLLTAAIQSAWGRRQSVRDAASSPHTLSLTLPAPLDRLKCPETKGLGPGVVDLPRCSFIACLEASWRRMRKVGFLLGYIAIAIKIQGF